MLTDAFRNALRDLVDDNKGIGELGTGDTDETVSDTDLESGVGATDISLTSSTSDKQLVLTYSLDAATGNGNTYNEYGNFLTDDTLINRVTFPDLAKTTSKEIQISTIIQFP